MHKLESPAPQPLPTCPPAPSYLPSSPLSQSSCPSCSHLSTPSTTSYLRHHQHSLTRSKSPSRLATPWLTALTVPRFGHPSSSSPHWSASLIQVEPWASFTFGPPEPFPLQPCAAWGPSSLLRLHILRAGGMSDAPSAPMSNALHEPGSVYALNWKETNHDC